MDKMCIRIELNFNIFIFLYIEKEKNFFIIKDRVITFCPDVLMLGVRGWGKSMIIKSP